jgi:hypothetical protein
MVSGILFPNNPFLSALVLSTIIVSVTDALMFYVLWIGKARLTPLFVIEVIIVTMVPLAINLWFHVFR